MKKILTTLLILPLMLVIFPTISAISVDIEFPNGDSFEAGDPITFKATIYDDSSMPIDGFIEITIQDSEKRISKAEVNSKEVSTVELQSASSGQGIITASYEDAKAIAFFEIGRDEQAKFELDGNTLIVTNIGNTPYSRTISITIGSTTGTQTPNLEIGEKTSYRLIAPEGVYNIRVTDGKTSLIRSSVKLTGTGNVIGAIDDSSSRRSGITGTVSPNEGNIALLSYIQDNKFVYVFIAVIFGAMILIAIERRYKRKLSSKRK